ncbi:MAG: hypothetical protein KA807_15865 [Prolixibacteraceae bacterium]|nr:hypothetical protein [Prolixibacteraceae bacterium]
MDQASFDFKACFIGIGGKGQEIGQCVNIEFKELIKCFQKYREDDPDLFAENETPLLTVILPNEDRYKPIPDLSNRDIIFLLGSQQDSFFWATREKLISENMCSFLFTLVLLGTGDMACRVQSSTNEAIIFFEKKDGERKITQFMKDMCRVWIFPRLLSRDFSDMKQALSSTTGRYLFFESQPTEYLPNFRQFLSGNIDTIKRASDVFYIASSNLGDGFSIPKHLHPIIDEIEKLTNSECSVIGGDALYAESESAFGVTMICSEKMIRGHV